jgi:phenylpyruvate tautomerase PptA (4-oxalocrotonate tautomerase family)
MPWVNVVTTRKLADAELEKLNAGITAALIEHADKQAPGVYVSVTRPEVFYWGQEKRDDSAIFDVRWIGEFSLEVKRQITRRFSTEIAPAIGLDPDRVRVLFTTFATADWGRSRGDYS